jgi:hypothetical protein
MGIDESFRVGLSFLLNLEEPTYAVRLYRCAGIKQAHWSLLMHGHRRFQEYHRANIANCLMLTPEEIIRLGEDLIQGVEGSAAKQRALNKRLALPGPDEPPNMTLWAVASGKRKKEAGRAWKLEKDSFLFYFTTIPELGQRYVLRPKDEDEK